MNAGTDARWYCRGCEKGSWIKPPEDMVACPDCCGFKKPETTEAAK